jgi:carboxyl-terminal processing protease
MLPSDPATPANPPTPSQSPLLSTPAAPDGPAPTPTTSLAGDKTAPALEVPATAVKPRGSGARVPILAMALVVVAILAGGALFVSGFLVGQRAAEQPGTPVANAEGFQPFWDSYNTIIQRFALGGANQTSLVNGAIKGMVESLGDPFSAYLTPDQYQQGLQDLSGQFEGIGAEIGTRDAKGATSDCTTLGANCILTVVSPIDGSPAQKAGVQAGDGIVAVDGTKLDGLTVDAARDKIRGQKGTQVVLSIVRGKAAPIDISVTRDIVVQKEVISKSLDNGQVGYLGVTGFSDNSAAAFHDALQADLKAGQKKFILDLRGNPGGYVNAAREIASQFIADGPIFWEQDASGNLTETIATGNGLATDPSIQVVVLVDKGSASASEIVAGAMQDRKRATIVGETSYGKGTVQQWIQLQDGSALKLTIAKWLTPDKRWIGLNGFAGVQHSGIVPDVLVATPTNPSPNNDPALDRAVQILTTSTSAELQPKAA